jgi:flagellar hook-associated protein 2
MATITPTFNAGGLASGMDTNSIVDSLVKLQQRPLDLLRGQQAALRSNISIFGDLTSKLSALGDAAKALGTGGVLGVKSTTSNTSFSAVPGSGAVAGSSRLQVDTLATAAKARSTAFAASDTVKAGSLDLVVDGVHYPTKAADGTPYPAASWAAGASLADVASAIRASGAPVTASVLFDGTSSYLSVTRRDTGFAGTDATKALVITESASGIPGKALGLAPLKDGAGLDVVPTNATFRVDGLAFTRTTNVISDALPGTTLTLKTAGGAAEDLTFENDVDATKKKLQTYVDAYNAVISTVQGQLAPRADTDRASTLSGNSLVRGLQGELQRLGATTVPGLGTVKSLADLGVKTNRDGTLAIDDATLTAAVGRDANAVNTLFSTASSGLADVVKSIADRYAKSSGGLFSDAKTSLDSSITRMDADADRMQSRLDAYRATLIQQFATMEQIVSGYKSIGTFLQNQSAAQQAK